MTRHLRLRRRAWAGLLPLLTVLMLLLFGIPGAFAAQVVPVSDLLVDGERFDGNEITIEGELVGDYGFRHDGYMWTQLNDDSYARDALVDGGPRAGANVGVGIRMPTALGEGLAPVGGYRLEGPLVQATGVWRYHDPERGGETYLDVSALTTIEDGRRLEEG
ncbi:MAG: hypothetical protein WCC01_10310, partial [Acidimicrobiia bacterium]